MKTKFLNFILILITIYTIFIILVPQNKISSPSSREFKSPFTIKKKVFYSGITPKNTTYTNNKTWSLNISQYTDIAIYIEQNSETLDDSNTIKSLYIDNLNFIKSPKTGTPNLYYQNPLKFATDYISDDYLIENHLNYNILNFENEDNFNYYSTPNFFTDCSIPITLKLVNTDVLKNFQLSNNKTLFFDGTILKNSNLKIEDLETKISFNINIVTNDNKLYKHETELDIPLANSQYNLFDQNIYLEKETNLEFKTE